MAAAVLLAGALLSGTAAYGQFLTITADKCQTDDEVAADQREPYEQAALRFATALVQQDSAELYLMSSHEARRAITPEQITTALLPQLVPFVQGIGERRVAHSYLVTVLGSKAEHVVTCTAVAKGSSATIGDKVLVAAKSASKQAHVIVEAEIPDHTVSFTFWLFPDGSDWLVHGLHAVWSQALGRTAVDYRALARDERLRGHPFNAAILLSGAGNLSYRGQYLQFSLWQDIQKELKEAERPQELKGDPPFTWRFEPDSFRVLALGPLVIEGRLGVMIRREVPSLADPTSVDRENRRLIAGLLEKRPEIREVFGALSVQAAEARSGRIYGTVELLRK